MKLVTAHGLTLDCNRGGSRVVGILNLSADSFSGDGIRDMQSRVNQILLAEADMIDVGAESTRPGAREMDPAAEKALVVPAVRYLRQVCSLPISVDTRKAVVADAALTEGANIINDVSGLKFDPEMIHVAARHKAGVVLSHSRGTPETMQDPENLKYDDVTEDVITFFRTQMEYAASQGVTREQILLDPGIGFAKNTEQNLELIRNCEVFRKTFDRPVFYGVSRKSFLGEITQVTNPAERDFATVAAITWLAAHHADFLRVHNVRGARDAVTVSSHLMKGKE